MNSYERFVYRYIAFLVATASFAGLLLLLWLVGWNRMLFLYLALVTVSLNVGVTIALAAYQVFMLWRETR